MLCTQCKEEIGKEICLTTANNEHYHLKCAQSIFVSGEFEKYIQKIIDYKNPYPRDIFLWDNKEKMDITRGRFNRMIHSVVENTRQEIINEIIEDV